MQNDQNPSHKKNDDDRISPRNNGNDRDPSFIKNDENRNLLEH